MDIYEKSYLNGCSSVDNYIKVKSIFQVRNEEKPFKEFIIPKQKKFQKPLFLEEIVKTASTETNLERVKLTLTRDQTENSNIMKAIFEQKQSKK